VVAEVSRVRSNEVASNQSFDVTTGVDVQEVDNAVNQAHKEIAQRFDFKGTNCVLELDRTAGTLKLEADDEYRLGALLGVLKARLIARGVSPKNLDEGKVDTASLGRARQEIALQQGIPSETAKRISKDVRDLGLKKVQVQIQGDQLRVQSPSRDALQEVMAFLKGEDYGIELQFGNTHLIIGLGGFGATARIFPAFYHINAQLFQSAKQ